jgi:hypothetical protein
VEALSETHNTTTHHKHPATQHAKLPCMQHTIFTTTSHAIPHHHQCVIRHTSSNQTKALRYLGSSGI